MSSEYSLKVVVAFNKLPDTPEKKLINDQFMNNEIGHVEFFGLAEKYLAEFKCGDHKNG